MAFTRYGELRNQLLRATAASPFAPAVLREADSDYVPIPISERLVQCIWYDQRLQTAALRTVDDQAVRVAFQGWWNLEAGPDFRHATVQIGDQPERTGDIEIHLRADDWFHHGHDRDPAYNNVILHVVLWQAGSERAPRTATCQAIPQLALEHQLDAPLESLHDEIDLEKYPHRAANHAGRCAPFLGALSADALAALLENAGDERFAAKTRRFTRWLHRAQPEQVFHEGWLEALGYKANKLAFRTLAQRLPIAELRERGSDLRAILFGVAGFLPVKAGKDAYVKKLWRSWWKLRPDFEDRCLPPDLWQLHGTRPANHPHRRLAAATWLLKRHPNLMEKILGALETNGDPGRLFAQMRDDYWSRHFTLGGKAQTTPTSLIGAARAREMVANVVLPFAAAYAAQSGNAALADEVRDRYAALPAAPTNSILQLAARQLFDAGPAARRLLRSTRQQQGLLQIFQDFCLNDKSGCRACQFPELARQWATG